METETATATPTATMPHLECVDRVKKIPLVEAALTQSAEMYEKVKGSSEVLNWTLSTAEATVQKAVEQAAPLAAPIASKLETPIKAVDQTFCKGLSMMEEKMPIVKEQPQQIYETAKSYLTPARDKVSAVKDFGTSKAHSLKELSWNKANEVLLTRYGNVAYNGFDTAAMMAEQYLNYYFPATEEELGEAEGETEQTGEDRVLHTVNTVGRLSNKFGRRVYRTLSGQVQNLSKQNVQEYITSLVAVMQLTTYLNDLYQKGAPATQSTEPAQESTSAQAKESQAQASTS